MGMTGPTGSDAAAADADIERFLPFFKAFCNGTRARVLGALFRGELCVCEITEPTGQSQPLVSHHLALLRDAGLVRARGEGARTYYSIDWERFDEYVNGFLQFVEASKGWTKQHAVAACVNEAAVASSRRRSATEAAAAVDQSPAAAPAGAAAAARTRNKRRKPE